MRQFYQRQLEARGLPWWLPVLACLLSAAALGLVSRNFYGQVPAGLRLLISASINEVFARGGLLLWAGAIFGLVLGLDSGFLKALLLSYWVLLGFAVLGIIFALLFAPPIQLPNLVGHELDTPDVEEAWRRLENSFAYGALRLGASLASGFQVLLTWWGVIQVGVPRSDARTAGLMALGAAVFLKILGLV